VAVFRRDPASMARRSQKGFDRAKGHIPRSRRRGLGMVQERDQWGSRTCIGCHLCRDRYRMLHQDQTSLGTRR
jgi:hypothetical protein